MSVLQRVDFFLYFQFTVIHKDLQMVNKFTEAQIITGLKNNDSRVCRYLFDTHYTPLLYFAEKIIADQDEAEDIIIQAFNKFWSMRENFASTVPIKAFLYITTKNNCLNFLKYRQRQKEGKKEYTSHLLSANQAEETERLVIESDFLNKVYLEVPHLPDKCKQIFLLTYFEGLRAGEIAERLNITVSTVTTQRSRAIKYLKQVLSGEDYALFCLILAGVCRQSRDIFP